MKKQLGIIAGTVPLDISHCKVEGIPGSCDTPWGMASECLHRLTFPSGETAIYLNRHGFAHRIAPDEINYRANVHAMKHAMVTHLLSISACGSLMDGIMPGKTIVIPTQLFDHTKGIRKHTFFNELAVHVSMADPICLGFAEAVYSILAANHFSISLGGTAVVIEGPQYSTRAESVFFRNALHAKTVCMTPLPEAKLAREAEMCYAVLQLPCDYDAWKEDKKGVTADEVHDNFGRFDMRLIMLEIAWLLENLPDRTCDCPRALEGFAVHTDIKALRGKQAYGKEFFSRWAELGIKAE